MLPCLQVHNFSANDRDRMIAITMAYIYILGIGMSTTVQYSILTNIGEATNISIADINTGTGLVS